MKIQSLFYLLTILSTTLAIKVTHKKEVAYAACKSLLTQFAGSTSLGSPDPFCDVTNQPAMGSMAICLVENFKESSKDYYRPYLKTCSISEHKFFASYKNATNHILEISLSQDSNTTHPTRLSYDNVQLLFNQLYRQALNDNYSIWFGTVLLAYWGLVMLVASLNYWSHFLFPRFVKSLHGSMSNFARVHFILSPTVGNTHASSVKYLKVVQAYVPLRFESIIVLAWTVLCFVFCGINHYPTRPNLTSLVGNRAALLAGFCVPLLILFAGRNNFLQWLTGWSHARFLLFHRWQARVVFIMILIHVSAKTSVLIKFDSYPSIFLQSYVAWAMVAAISLGLLIGHSWQYFRNSSYEIFLIVHHILAALFIAGAWIHTRGADTPYAYYAATAIWLFDKLARLIRVSLFGVKKAKVELISDEVLKVIVPRPRWWKPFPGSYAYIYFLKPATFWQSHPFTIIDSVDDANTLTFCIKIKGGITHGICQQLVRKTNQMDYFHVLIEGPYSRPHSGRHFENLVMLSTGTGIPGPYYTALDLIRKNDNSTKRIKFYWIIRDVKSINWFLEELCKLEGTIVETVIYICNTNTNFPFLKSQEMSKQFDSDAEKVSYSSDYLKHRLQFVDFRYGRPSIREIVHQEVKEARNSIGFITCGAPQMVDHARMTIVDSLKHDTSKRVELFEDFQEW